MSPTQARDQHKTEVLQFLQTHLSREAWGISLPPHGTGHETYYARGDGQGYFIKLGVQLSRYRVMASLGLTPPVVAHGTLADGTPLLVQPLMEARNPTRWDFHQYLGQFAGILHGMHGSQDLIQTLPGDSSASYQQAGLAALAQVQARWEQHKSNAPSSVRYIDECLVEIKGQIQGFRGAGLAACHHDVCNANWLVSGEGRVYLVDLEAMALDDPAVDLGALLWWYYPAELWPRFLEAAGYGKDPGLRDRMRVRMALHCLHIVLPRQGSFDRFRPDWFEDVLEDFRAVMDGKGNPKGY